MNAFTQQQISPELAAAIEYTDLRKDITYADVERMCLKTRSIGCACVVVPSILVPLAAQCVSGASVGVGTLIAYPFGTQATDVKAKEVRVAVSQGATEIEIIPHYGTLRAGRWPEVEAELSVIRKAADGAVLKLVLETSYLTADELRSTCAIASDLGYTYAVNTTGFRVVSTEPETAGQADPQIVQRLLEASGGRLRVKAAGGIENPAAAQELLNAGATRVAIEANNRSF